MRGIGIILCQQLVEPMFGIVWKFLWKVEPDIAQAWGANRNQQGRNRLASFTQICDARFDQIGSWQSTIHGVYFTAKARVCSRQGAQRRRSQASISAPAR